MKTIGFGQLCRSISYKAQVTVLSYVTSHQKFMRNNLLAVVCEGEPQQVVAVVTRTAQAFERHSPVDARLLNATGSFVVDEHEASVVMKAEAAFLVLPRNR